MMPILSENAIKLKKNKKKYSKSGLLWALKSKKKIAHNLKIQNGG
jgi:hypothetical protein